MVLHKIYNPPGTIYLVSTIAWSCNVTKLPIHSSMQICTVSLNVVGKRTVQRHTGQFSRKDYIQRQAKTPPPPATRQPAQTKCLGACPRGSAAAGCVSRTREQFGQDTYVRTQCGRDGGASTGDSAGVQLLEMFSFRFWIFFSFKLISPAQIILSCCFLIKLSTYIIHCFYLSSEDRVAGGSRWPNIDCVWLLACWLGSCS